ncbi:MAG: hypothetical protein Q8K18_12010 [Burkholderiales bacterium]|nr:hypothetical protein [Burkholderiales bacterium]
MKSTQERSKKNTMQVTFFQPAWHFDTQSFFLKQPVAEAPINNEPLTLRAPVNEAKSDRLLAAKQQ